MIVIDINFASRYKELKCFFLKALVRLLKKHIESFGKKAIFLTNEREYRSAEIETSQFVCGQTDYVLVTTPPYIKGFECEAIIDFTSTQEPDVLSRATIRVIKAPGRNEIVEIT